MRIALVLLAACGLEQPDPEATVEQLAQNTITTRSIPVTANTFADWDRAMIMDPTIVANGTLRVRLCEAHFPIGSQVRANAVAAVNAYSGAAGVAIDITDIANQPGTAVHPNLATFTLPTNAIYLDFDDTLASNVFASTANPAAFCDASSPRRCSKARIYVNPDSVPVGEAPSVGVFMHELGHVFGLTHINEDDDSVALNDPWTMSLDRTVVHGKKLHGDDFRSTVIHAATLVFLQHYYPQIDPALATNEIVTHRNVSLADSLGTMHVEFNPSKSYADWGTGGSLIADKNETKLRWNQAAENGAGAFEPCRYPRTQPRWFARMSETSTNTLNTPFVGRFQVSSTPTDGTWTTVAEHTFDSHNPAHTAFRQLDWERTFALSGPAAGIPANTVIAAPIRRRLRFEADATNVLAERSEGNNAWEVNLCLYPPSDTTCDSPAVVCAQP